VLQTSDASILDWDVHGGDDDDLARVMCVGEPNKEEMDLSLCVVYILCV
jgi:hypothetical protein